MVLIASIAIFSVSVIKCIREMSTTLARLAYIFIQIVQTQVFFTSLEVVGRGSETQLQVR